MIRKLLLGVIAAVFGASLAGAQTAFIPTVPNYSTIGTVVIAAGNTFQSILPAIPTTASVGRRSITIQNNNATDSCWIFLMGLGETTPTKARAILLLSGGSYTRYFPLVPSDGIQATCATTGDSLYVDTQ